MSKQQTLFKMKLSPTNNRGFFGIGMYMPKTSENIGTLWRSAANFGASFMFTIGARTMIRQASDTEKSERHIPFYVYPDLGSFLLPVDCFLVGIEQVVGSQNLKEFNHPQRACYILGSEDNGLSTEIISHCTGGIIHIDTPRCLNVSVAGSIVLYDRHFKSK